MLEKRARDKQQQNQQIKVEKDRENVFVFVDQDVVGLRRFQYELVHFVVESRLQAQNAHEPAAHSIVDVQQKSALEMVFQAVTGFNRLVFWWSWF